MTVMRHHFCALFLLALVGCEGDNNASGQAPSPVTLAAATAESEPAYAPVTVPMELQRVSEHVYFVQGAAGVATDNEGFISNAGFVVTDAGVIVFDALGTPSLAALLLRKIRETTDKPIVKVIVSHYHADHIYGLQVFKDLGAEIDAPAGAHDYLESDAAVERLIERRFSLEPWVNEQTRLVPPDHVLKEPAQIEMGGVTMTIDVLGSAHSDGDLTLFVEADKVLFAGDIIFEGRVPFLGDANTRHWQQTLERMETSKLVALIPGHGPAARDPNQAITQTRQYLAYLREKMGAAVDNLTPFDEAYAGIDWSAFDHLPAFAEANRRNAYQVYLSMEQEALAPQH